MLFPLRLPLDVLLAVLGMAGLFGERGRFGSYCVFCGPDQHNLVLLGLEFPLILGEHVCRHGLTGFGHDLGSLLLSE